MKLLIVFLISIAGCRTFDGASSTGKAEFSKDGVPTDWGHIGINSGPNQSIESHLANRAARNLNEAAQLTELIDGFSADTRISDAIVSFPIKFLTNDEDGHNHPFGDGQKNATVGWLGWPSNLVSPPVALTLSQVNGSAAVSSILTVEADERMISMVSPGHNNLVDVELTDADGNLFTAKMALDEKNQIFRTTVMLGGVISKFKQTEKYKTTFFEAPKWLESIGGQWNWPRVKIRFITSKNKSDFRYFPVLFRFPSQLATIAQDSLPQANKNFKQGIPIGFPPFGNANGATSSEKLQNWFLAQDANARAAEFFPGVIGAGVHNNFRDSKGKEIPTASGGVDTYVMKEKVGTNQVLYTCFDARNQGEEARLAVPSGAGWHSIGHDLPGQSIDNWTFAETVLNTFERSGIFAGWGVRTPNPFPEDAPFEAKDVASFRVLRSGEAYTTLKSHFHWYAVDATQKVCTVIWKHLGCELRNDRDLQCR
ncbi:MAG: hypothetical protein NT027_15475 [Proteobacteria bacterium]|nr:hypothetical protein [Pseudomonadota bacterium]